MTLDIAWPSKEWGVAAPESQGINPSALSDAVHSLEQRETVASRDMKSYLGAILSRQTHPEVLGPVQDSCGASGVVIRSGFAVATWGDPGALEMSYSATKTYLSAAAGVAFDHGLITDVDEPVAARVQDPAFVGLRRDRITWRHLLQQTSEWDGELWDRPWWSDPQGEQDRDTVLGEPGSAWAYNDVRVNLVALALTRLFGRSLEDAMRGEVMLPIGGSPTWRWYGYRDSRVRIDGQRVTVVSGGAHWGGGLWSSAWDHARFGYLYLRGGRWRDRRVLSQTWIDMSHEPCDLNPSYGFMWWLNRRGDIFPAAPRSGYCARGNAGRQLVWVDPERDLVIVSRWADDVNEFLGRVSDAVR